MKLAQTILAVLGLTTALISCETEYNNVGTQMLDNDLIGFEKYTATQINAATYLADDVNTRDYTINSLGHHNDAVFGTQTQHLVAQVGLSKTQSLSSIGDNPVIDSVYLHIPFKADALTKANARVVGNGTFDLKVYENGYTLSTSNPANNFSTQYYFSDLKNQIDQNIASTVLNNSTNTQQNTQFKFNTDPIKLYQYDANGQLVKDENNNPKVKETKSAGIWLDLDKNHFQNKFFANNKYKTLINEALFKEYFKGLYLQVNNPTSDALAQFDLTEGSLVFVYKQDKSDKSGKERKELVFTLGRDFGTDGNKNNISVALIENQHSGLLTTALAQANNPLIFLKGNQPTYSKISLFGTDGDNNGKPDELDAIIANNWMINQAVLTLTIDTQTSIANAPNRLFLYDFKNNKVLEDYALDQSTNPLKENYNGILNSGTKKYQFRITNYLKSLIEKDSTNFDLGLVVANEISNSLFNVTKNNKKLPLTASEMPFGTVLYGPNHTDVDKKMKLEIYYTKK